MTTVSRGSIGCLLGLAAFFALSCERPQNVPTAELDTAIERAAAYLISAERDGLWPSQTYGHARDGVALTPHTLSTLVVLAPNHEATQRGLDTLRRWADADDTQAPRFQMPAYTLAAASWCLGIAGDDEGQQRLIDRLLDHQLTEQHGWSPSDPGYGGFGDRATPSVQGVGPPATANVSATLFAVGAIRLAGRLDEPTRRAARVFAERCQNRVDPGSPGHPAADGGFFFSPTDPGRNKAGGLDGRPRSYASATADGVRLLLNVGVSHDDPAVAEARGWLVAHFDADHVAGDFQPDREPLRDSYYFYTAWSVAHAMHRLGVDPAVWAAPLAEALLARQRDDGSWANRFTDGHEDDPLVATPLAAAALAVCRDALAQWP